MTRPDKQGEQCSSKNLHHHHLTGSLRRAASAFVGPCVERPANVGAILQPFSGYESALNYQPLWFATDIGECLAPRLLLSPVMRIIMPRFCSAALLGAALLAPLAMAPMVLRAEDNKTASSYHDKKHNDDHEW